MEKDNYIYSPPAWRVCEVCDPVGILNRYEDLGRNISTDCSYCRGEKLIALYYTPEKWKEAGGILSDDTPVYMQDDDFMWYLMDYADVPKNMDMIIATTAGRPPEDWNG